MKTAIRLFLLIHTLPIVCLGAPAISTGEKETVYTIESTVSSLNELTVRVDRTEHHTATHLKLIGTSYGIPSQVHNVTCNSLPVKEDKPGTWVIPQECGDLQWRITLNDDAPLASKQQSLKSHDLILLSEVSSLPRLEDARAPEMIRIAIPGIKTIFPKPESSGLIPLSEGISTAPPLFIILNANIVDRISAGLIELSYLLDDPQATNRLPNMASHMEGLKWLNKLMPGKSKENFTIAWLGVSAKQMTLTGATGNGVLLVNYANDKELPFGKVMLLYVTLHEAVHQLAEHYISHHPVWIAESLASYYGVRAAKVALPNDPRVTSLIERFQSGSKQFADGLLTINHKVEQGIRSEYGAFYTKGLAFWLEVDEALQQTRGDSVDHHIDEIFQAPYGNHGGANELEKILDLPAEIWASLRRRFLD